ncbi:Sulfotransferase family protein [Epibacterium ulvae]|uniref:Sulfotransferase family protein n=1 Tax=Epibacterium ulvae TaxID=1156985 RepID=A0A1G5RCY3_9RHOB|nr:sulfotransferase family 2 domain-containing protein [Epibacterium ulvae]SCZ71915.1 Sulfotransferase family protein [Epibacterium ulvae]
MQKISDAASQFERRFSPQHVAANTFNDPADIILFMHIPKTAGMSVGKALQNAFDIFHPVSWENTGKSFRQKTKQALYIRTKEHTGEGPVRQVLMGHFGWGDVMFWKNHELPIKCATIIRDPLARFVSNYRYNCSERHPQHEAFKARFPTLEDYAQQLPNDYQLNLMIGPFYSFDDALEKLSRTYSFIGITEHLGASLDHFRNSHGLAALPEHRENSGENRSEEIPDSVRNLIAEKSHNDMRLHQLIQGFYAAPQDIKI